MDVSATKTRELTLEDLGLLDGTLGSQSRPIAKIRSTHHALAKLIAEGRKAVEISAIMGYSQSRISILQRDPSFAELVAYYKDQVNEAFASVHQRLADLSLLATEELHARLEETPESLSAREVLEIAEYASDRSGAGKQSTQLNVNVDLAGRLERARQRVGMDRGAEGATHVSGPAFDATLGPVPENQRLSNPRPLVLEHQRGGEAAAQDANPSPKESSK